MVPSTVSTRPADPISGGRRPSESSYELWAVIASLTLLYVVLLSFANRRFLWFDELFTLDLAKAKSIPQMWQLIRRFDFQLPLGFLLSRFSMKLLGQSPLGLRLPSMLAFYVASMALFFYVRRKVGISYAVAATLLLWLGQTFRYATEARPYALLLMFFSTLLLCWDSARTPEQRRFALWGVALSNLGMFSAHVFAPFSLFPFLAAELFLFWRTRKPDFALWAALLLPAVTMAFYLPAFSGYQALYFPLAYQASLARAPHFYHAAIAASSVALFMAVFAALMVPLHKPKVEITRGWRPEEVVLLICLLLNPVLLNVALMRRHGAFWDRYAITTEAAIYIGMAILLGIRLGMDRLAGYAAAAVLLLFCMYADVWYTIANPSPENAAVLSSIRPDLPLVDAGGVTFFEMNHHESPDFLARLYFLKDRPLALSYTGTNLFEDRGFGDGMRPYFPIRAHVAAYSEFIRQHSEFLVFGTYDAPEEWLLRKLHDDGARLIWLGSYPAPYADANLYLVNLNKQN